MSEIRVAQSAVDSATGSVSQAMWREACQKCFTDDAWLATLSEATAAEGGPSNPEAAWEVPFLAVAALTVMRVETDSERTVDVPPRRPERP